MWCMQECDLDYLLDYFNVKACDVWEENVKTSWEIELSTSIP